jgi:lia operon protein LiaF
LEEAGMNPQFFQKLTWGLVLITAGVFFLLNHIGLISIHIGELFSTYWPVFLIYFGLMGFIWKLRVHLGSSIWSLLLCAAGIIFLLKNLGVTNLSLSEMFQYLGPAALIIFGISIIFKPSGSHKEKGKESWDWESHANTKKQSREAWREQRDAHRAAYREQREQYRKERDSYKSERHRPNHETEAPKQERDEAKQRDLSDEEKEVLKDIHGEFGADKHNEPWDLPDPPTKSTTSTTTEPPRRTSHPYEKKNKYYEDFVNNYNVEGAQFKSSFIGDVHLGQEPWELKPMVISHFIGDTVIDLTRASIPFGETPITVSAFIGDVKIFIPNDMDLEVRVISNSFIGDMRVLDRHESGMFRHLTTQTLYFEEAQRKLILTTNMFIGDVVVKKIG